ncbi:MAG: hypothetical protein HXS48_10960 [Theionarchaea archaeon]|nr:hypothetical protein [Theionarchaea archaeon]
MNSEKKLLTGVLCIATLLSLIFSAFAFENVPVLSVNFPMTEECIVPVSGPSKGNLIHVPDDNTIEEYYANVDVKDFIVEATFHNPHSSTEGAWDYGFLCRHLRDNTHYVVWVESDGSWEHAVVIDGNWNYLKNGYVSELQTGANQSNHLRIIVIGDIGWFFVNG